LLRCYERVVFSRQAAEVEDCGAIPVWRDGTAVRSYTYLTDMVDGIYRLL
jgi:GDP-D-mannose 3',5'-epimerase